MSALKQTIKPSYSYGLSLHQFLPSSIFIMLLVGEEVALSRIFHSIALFCLCKEIVLGFMY